MLTYKMLQRSFKICKNDIITLFAREYVGEETKIISRFQRYQADRPTDSKTIKLSLRNFIQIFGTDLYFRYVISDAFSCAEQNFRSKGEVREFRNRTQMSAIKYL